MIRQVIFLFLVASTAGEVTLSELWGRASSISEVIDQIFPNWHSPFYDGDSTPMNSIKDGGSDLFDNGNMVRYYEGSNTASDDFLTYGRTYNLDTSVIKVGVTSHPFISLAWITNKEAKDTNYTIQVDSNLGADGSGVIAQFNGSITVNKDGKGLLNYQVFQVYNANRAIPTYCEVFFAISYEGWKSSSLKSNLHFMMLSSGTDAISNTATLDGAIQNVAFGYVLLSVNNGQMITKNNIENFLNQLILRIIDDETVVPVQPTGACGETIYLKDAITTTMFHPLAISGARNCEIIIQGLFGYKIEASMNVSFPDGYLQIYERSRFVKSLSRYGNDVCVGSTGNVLRLLYRSYSTKSKLRIGEGITATYSQYISSCGQELLASSTKRNITAIGSPGGSPSDNDCFWRIRRQGSRPTKLVIKRLTLENVNSYLQICEDLKQIKRIDSSITAPITLYGVGFGIRYKGGSKSSLVATYQEYPCDATFTLKENEGSSFITSSMLGIIGNDVKSYQCRWNFVAQPSNVLVVELGMDRDTRRRSSLYAFSNNTRNRWNPQGSLKSYLSNSGFLRLDFYISQVFSTPQVNFTFTQYKPSCGKILNATSLPKTINKDTGSASDCLWIIPGALIKFTIDNLKLESGDYLEVFEGPYIISRFSESLQSPISLLARTSLGMYILYHKSSNNGKFSATYKTEPCIQTYELIDTKQKISLQIPTFIFDYPNYYHLTTHETTCDYYFNADKGEVIDMDIQHNISRGFLNTIRVFDNRTLLGYYSNAFNGIRSVMSRGPNIRLQMSFRFYYYPSSNHFYNSLRLSVAVTLKQIQWTCGEALYARPVQQTIAFPGNSLTTTNNDCVWVITPSSSFRKIQINIAKLEGLEGEDYLQVSSKLTELEKFKTITKSTILLSDVDQRSYIKSGPIQRMTIYMHTESNKDSFIMRASYKEVVCGKTIITSISNSDRYLYFPGNIRIPPSNFTCDYSFISPGDDWLMINVTDRYPQLCCNEVKIFQNNKLLTSINRRSSSTTFLTSESQVRLHYVANSSNFRRNRYFVKYRRFKNNCGIALEANDVEKTITSPGYPRPYEISQDCVWKITSRSQKQIRFILDVLDVDADDYLEITDGDKTTERYTGTISSPVTFYTTGSKLRIYFHSGLHGTSKGFRAEVIEATNPCSENPCLNNGVCAVTETGYKCFCEEPYISFWDCAFANLPCVPDPCGNHGQCRQINNSHLSECVCDPGYSGDRCYGNVNECVEFDKPCADNAICTDIEAGYNCTCIEGYRGDGKEKCYEIILLPYGNDVGDSLIPPGDENQSPVEKLDFEIPFGSKSYSDIQVTSNGLIYLGRSKYSAGTLNRPTATGFPTSSDAAILAPFWDDFHPSKNNSGRVYYKSYNTIENMPSDEDKEIIDEVKHRISQKYNLDNFDPIFVFKATWSEVVMYPEDFPGHRRFASTFQAVLATDGCDTYLIYLYKEDAMLWEPGIRSTDNVLIGYSNGDDMIYIESQGDYRPDKSLQKEGGNKPGQYFYKLSASNTKVQQARCKCLKWYLNDLKSQWMPERIPCPCSSFQASQDPRFTRSLDYASVKHKLPDLDSANSDIVKWALDSVSHDRCYQLRNNIGPRCCYGLPRRWFMTSLWGEVGGGPLLRGPFGSRYERFQIPTFTENDTRSQESFENQFKKAFNEDLLPRRQCCVESESGGYCKMYERRRPSPSCQGYNSTVPTFLWGDPHITTFTGISYTFNGLGEFYLVNTPEFSLQSRTKNVLKEDGSSSDATIFTSLAGKDFTKVSGKVQFDVDYNDAQGSGVIVKVNGVKQRMIYGKESVVDNVILQLDENGYSAIFPSLQKVSVKSNSYILTFVFIGNQNLLKSKTGGLLGDWTENKANTFKMRNGNVMNYESLKVTKNLDILKGRLSEKKLYSFGLSWKIRKSESLFSYTGGSDTYEAHNPLNPEEPPFLEDLVSQQRNTPLFNIIVSNCTIDNQLSVSCLYDTMTTNRYDIGQATLNGSISSEFGSALNSNTPPTLSVNRSSTNFVDGYFRVKVNEEEALYLVAEDREKDHVTFWLSKENTIDDAVVEEETGILRWKPNISDLSVFNKTLEVVAVDSKDGESLMIIPVKLCACYNGGKCVFDDVISSSVNYQTVGCNCTEAWSGDDCTEDRNDCNLSACHPGVPCNDVPAPGVGFECGSCPEGTTGDGRSCITINMCDSNPCNQICQPILNGYNCSCKDGYQVDTTDSTNCIDINECLDNSICSGDLNSECINNEGSFSCECLDGFMKNGSKCDDVDECSTDLNNCAQNSTCINTFGSFYCECDSINCVEETTQSPLTTEGTTRQSTTTSEITTQQSMTNEDSTTSDTSPTKCIPPVVTKRIRCYSGIRLSISSFEQNFQRKLLCDEGFMCSDVSATATVKRGRFSFPATVAYGQCIPSTSCNSVSCDVVRTSLPPNLPITIKKCASSFCVSSLCNGPG